MNVDKVAEAIEKADFETEMDFSVCTEKYRRMAEAAIEAMGLACEWIATPDGDSGAIYDAREDAEAEVEQFKHIAGMFVAERFVSPWVRTDQ